MKNKKYKKIKVKFKIKWEYKNQNAQVVSKLINTQRLHKHSLNKDKIYRITFQEIKNNKIIILNFMNHINYRKFIKADKIRNYNN